MAIQVSPAGLVITNHHVIEGARMVEIRFPGGPVYIGQEWTGFPEIDLAAIKIEGENLPILELEHNTGMDAGDEVIVIGNPPRF